MISLVLFQTFALGLAVTAEVQTPPLFRVESDRGLAIAGRHVIRSKKDWVKLWNSDAPDSLCPHHVPPAPLPAVDFKKYDVIAAFAGQKSSTGFGIEISSVEEAAEDIRVRVVETAAGPGCLTAQAFTCPKDIIKLPKLRKPVVFEEIKRVKECR